MAGGNSANESGYGAKRSGYGANRSGYGAKGSGHSAKASWCGVKASGCGAKRSGYDVKGSGYSVKGPGCGAKRSGTVSKDRGTVSKDRGTVSKDRGTAPGQKTGVQPRPGICTTWHPLRAKSCTPVARAPQKASEAPGTPKCHTEAPGTPRGARGPRGAVSRTSHCVGIIGDLRAEPIGTLQAQVLYPDHMVRGSSGIFVRSPIGARPKSRTLITLWADLRGSSFGARLAPGPSPVYPLCANRGTVPKDRGTVPKDQGTVPKEQGTVPKDRGTVPTYRGMVRPLVPKDRGTVPTDRSTVPKDRGTVPKALSAAKCRAKCKCR